MTRKEFRDFVEKKCEEILALLDKKGEEYSDGKDAFYNFEEGYKLATSNSPEEFAWDLRCKHLQSIKDLISNRDIKFTKAQGDEKFGDDILYSFIIWAITQKYYTTKESSDYWNAEREFVVGVPNKMELYTKGDKYEQPTTRNSHK